MHGDRFNKWMRCGNRDRTGGPHSGPYARMKIKLCAAMMRKIIVNG